VFIPRGYQQLAGGRTAHPRSSLPGIGPTPTGVEQPPQTLGKVGVLESEPLPVPLPESIEFLAVFSSLEPSARRDLLAIAKAWAMQFSVIDGRSSIQLDTDNSSAFSLNGGAQ